MTRPSSVRLAQVSIVVLLLVIIRSLSEVFRIQYLNGPAIVIEKVTPFIAGALFAVVALALAIICYFANLYRIVMVITTGTLVVLFVYKVVVVG